MTAPGDVTLVGFAELSATVVGARLPAAHDRFRDRAGPDEHRLVLTRSPAR